MIVSIHQPQYMPYLGYFDKISRSDAFVFLDDVQYKKNEWQNRNRIRNARGWQWITVPVKYSFGQMISQVAIADDTKWRKDHYKSLVINYGKAPYFRDYEGLFKEIYEKEWRSLSDINIHLTERIAELVGIKTRLIRASLLKTEGRKTEKLVAICRELKAGTYLSGDGGRAYLELGRFEKEGIEVVFQDFQHPTYEQAHKPFIPFMSILDLLFNHGTDSLRILSGSR